MGDCPQLATDHKAQVCGLASPLSLGLGDYQQSTFSASVQWIDEISMLTGIICSLFLPETILPQRYLVVMSNQSRCRTGDKRRVMGE